MKVSILLLTMDRYEYTVKTLEHNFSNHGYDDEIELLWCDNGSKDKRVIEYVSKHPLLTYKRLNSVNEGVAKALNQLIIRANGEFLFFMANDILNDPNWLKECISIVKALPNVGLIGLQCTLPPETLTTVNGVSAHFASLTPGTCAIFGPTGFTKEAIIDVGGYSEEYSLYGIEDSCLNWRMHFSGRHLLYLPGIKSNHIGHDEAKSEYRIFKNEQLEIAHQVAAKTMGLYNKDNYRVKLAEPRDPT